LLDQHRSPQSLIRAACRQARSRPYISFGVAAGTTAAVLGMSAGVASAATTSPAAPATPAATSADLASAAGQASPLAAAASAAQAGQAGWSPAVSGQLDPAQAFGAIPAPAASATPLAASHVAPAALSTPSSSTSPVQPPTAQQASAAPTQAPAKRQWPYQMYDSTTPGAIPAGHVIATYATGPYAVPASQVAGRPVFWIDTNGSDPGAQALDVEPGDATPQMAATWTWQKLHADPTAKAIIYTMRSEWPATQAAIGTLPQWMQSHVRWWIADPTGYPHVVPGSNATQWYWGTNYDISTVLPGF